MNLFYYKLNSIVIVSIETIKKYYFQDSLLYLASIIGDATYDKLYDEILLSLQPLPFIPFQLSLSFEVQTPSHLSPSVSGSHSRSVSPAPSPLHSHSNSLIQQFSETEVCICSCYNDRLYLFLFVQ